MLTYIYRRASPLTLSDGTEISSAESTKDLGVTVASTFKTSLHCQRTANRARRILFLLRHGFAILIPEIFRPLYLALLRPILEYGQQAASPYLRRDIDLMERIQRLATRMVEGMRGLPYENRLRQLNIFSLERRRLHGELILAYNILHGRLDLPQAEFFEAPADRALRGHNFKLRQRSFRLLRRKAAFSVRIPISSIKLPMDIVNSPRLDTFMRLLDSAWFSLFPSLP